MATGVLEQESFWRYHCCLKIDWHTDSISFVVYTFYFLCLKVLGWLFLFIDLVIDRVGMGCPTRAYDHNLSTESSTHVRSISVRSADAKSATICSCSCRVCVCVCRCRVSTCGVVCRARFTLAASCDYPKSAPKNGQNIPHNQHGYKSRNKQVPSISGHQRTQIIPFAADSPRYACVARRTRTNPRAQCSNNSCTVGSGDADPNCVIPWGCR